MEINIPNASMDGKNEGPELSLTVGAIFQCINGMF